MKIAITSPFPVDSTQGNSVSARRIARLIEQSGHSVVNLHKSHCCDADIGIFLNAWRSSEEIARFASESSGKLVVVLTGSDIYPLDGKISAQTRHSLSLADAIVITHNQGITKLEHPCIVEIGKSIDPLTIATETNPADQQRKWSEGVMVSHLREQKNPFLYLRALPHIGSHLSISHYGTATDTTYAEEAASAESAAYQWLGAIPREELLKQLANAGFLLNTSYLEGSSNAICEALWLGVPVIASAIPGNIGVLGSDYPGLFRSDDPIDLARVLNQYASEPVFREELMGHTQRLAHHLDPTREQSDWHTLLSILGSSDWSASHPGLDTLRPDIATE